MRSDKKIILHCLKGLLAFSILVLTVSSCAHQGTALKTGPDVPADNEFIHAVRDLKLGNTARARAGLLNVLESGTSMAQSARASFLLGVLIVEEGGHGAGTYLDGATALSGIPDYVAFYRARAYALDGDYAKAVAGFDSMLKDYPGSTLVTEAAYYRALALLDGGRLSEAKAALDGFVSNHPRSALAPEALLKSAEALVRLGDTAGAALVIKRILTDYPATAEANGAEALMAGLAPGGENAPEFTPAERYRRASRFFNSAYFDDAVEELAPLVRDKKGEFYDRAVMKTAVSFVRLKDYDRAASVLKSYLSPGAARPKRELEALYWSALVSVRLDSEAGIVAALKSLTQKYPQSTERAQALLFLARRNEARGQDAKAMELYKEVMDGFKGTSSAEEAAWSRGWMYYRSGDFASAFKTFSNYSGPGTVAVPRFLYWSGRSAENMGFKAEAVSRYGLLCDVSEPGYYCRMAQLRLRAMKVPPAPREPVAFADASAPAEKPWVQGAEASKISKDAHYIAAKELLALGMNARAATEAALLTRGRSSDPASLVEIAGLFYQAGDFYNASRVYDIYLSGLDLGGADGAGGLSVLTFPPQLVELVKEKSPEGSIDPYLVAAVMREESSFNPKAVSTTGALGLMQIMPETGRFIAGKLGRTLDDDSELFDPDVNIKLGTWYLGHLARRFDGDLVLTIASYNAGPGAVQRWTQTLPADLDEFIESIPYPETRRYAKKVLKSYGEFLRTGGVDTTGFLNRTVLRRQSSLNDAPAGTLTSGRAQSVQGAKAVAAADAPRPLQSVR